MQAFENRRREPRIRMDQTCVLATESAVYDCRLVDLSESGARLVFDKPVFMRGAFELSVDEMLCETCVAVWRSAREMGVSFQRAA
jgi:hypothetical protein